HQHHPRPVPSIHPLFFFNDPPTTEISTLSLHDALPILPSARQARPSAEVVFPLPGPVTTMMRPRRRLLIPDAPSDCRPLPDRRRSEEHTSELQSLTNLVCRLLLEKKTNKY